MSSCVSNVYTRFVGCAPHDIHFAADADADTENNEQTIDIVKHATTSSV